MEAALMDLISAFSVLATSALFGLVKKNTDALDGKIGNAIKPMQPAIMLAAGLGLPYLTSVLGIAPIDPQVFVTAPTATIAMISMREGTARITGRKKNPGT